MFSFLTRKKKPKRKVYIIDTVGDNASIYQSTTLEDMHINKCEPSYDNNDIVSSTDGGSCGGD